MELSTSIVLIVPWNIFARVHFYLQPNAIIKLIDFGVSQEYSPKDNILSERVGTLYSMAPETMLGKYTSQADLWSLGVIAFMLLADGHQPFDEATPKIVIAKVLLGKYNFDGEPWQQISDSAKAFIRKLLVVRPDDRMTAQTAKQHPWIVENHKSNRHLLSDVDEDFKQKVRECIIRYTEQSQFVKLARNVIAKQSTPKEIFRLRSVFDEFDTDNTGTLSLAEFKAALSQFNLSDDDLEEMFHSIVRNEVSVRMFGLFRYPSICLPQLSDLQDINGNNQINYTEFLAATLETQGMIEERRLAEAFDLMDSDDSGYSKSF